MSHKEWTFGLGLLLVLILIGCEAAGQETKQEDATSTSVIVKDTPIPEIPENESSIEVEVITPTAQEMKLTEPISTIEVEPAETEAVDEPEPTIEAVGTGPSESPTIEKGSLEFEGQNRNYMVFLPNTYNDAMDFPLVIYLHSFGWTAQQGMNYTMLNEVADTYDFIIVYPSARNNWHSGIEDNPIFSTPDINDVGFINAMIDTLIDSYSIDPERIFAAGYSNGGFMAYRLACQLSHRIAAIASVSGVFSTSIAASCAPLHAMPILEIHGTLDPIVPLDGATGWLSVDETLSFWINFNNCTKVETNTLEDSDPTDGSTVEKTYYMNCTDSSNVIYYKVINGGHTWPGAGPPGYSAGDTNQDIKAGEEIWNFFKDYQLTSDSIEGSEEAASQ